MTRFVGPDGCSEAENGVMLHEGPGARAVPHRGRLGLFHFAILLPDRPSLGRFVQHLAARAVQWNASAKPAPSRRCSLGIREGLDSEWGPLKQVCEYQSGRELLHV